MVTVATQVSNRTVTYVITYWAYPTADYPTPPIPRAWGVRRASTDTTGTNEAGLRANVTILVTCNYNALIDIGLSMSFSSNAAASVDNGGLPYLWLFLLFLLFQ